MFQIIIRTLIDKKTSILAYCFAGMLFTWMFVAIYPSFLDQAEEFQKMVENYPEAMMKMFDIEDISFETLENFLDVENYSIIMPLMVIFFVVSFAGATLAREVEKGTIEHILAKPISRLRLYFGRYIAGLVAIAVFVNASVFSVILFVQFHGVEYHIGPHVKIAALSMLLGWAVFSMASMFSAISSERSRAYMFCGAILFLMYVANIAAALIEKAENLQYISFFYYYDHAAAMTQNEFNFTSLVVFSIAAVVCTIIGAWVFQKRDIAV